jgi:hypothetical protein
MVLFPALSPRKLFKNMLKLKPKIYVLQCTGTLYVYSNVHLGLFKKFNENKDVPKIF